MSVFKLAKVITAHAWNGDRSMVAVCENSNVVTIYGNASAGNVSQWEKKHILEAHSMVICGIDWHPVTNQIVTCSHDVNAFVWSYDTRNDTWSPSLSILRINRAALQVKWSPDGTKFAVATGSKLVPVCYYDSGNDWWISNTKNKKMHNSTILDVAWHPNSQIIATASCDFRCRIYSVFMPKREQAVSPAWCPLDDMEFGTLITEFKSSNGWVQGVTWSPSGNQLAFCGHDSSVHLVSFPNGQPFCQSVKTQLLPYQAVLFLNDDVLIAAGYGFIPDVFQREQRKWKLLGPADLKTEKPAEKAQKPGTFAKRFGEFNARETTGTMSRGSSDLRSKHQNVITDLRIYGTSNHLEADSFSSSGNDGRIVIWKSADLHKAVPNIKAKRLRKSSSGGVYLGRRTREDCTMTSVYQLANVITAHAWNADCSMVAVCENDSDVLIYKNCREKDVSKWEKAHVLRGHSMVVCGIDWHPVTNKIVTCSHDINTFVWTYSEESDTWSPSLSILRINRAALQVRWSPDGTKFAVATGSKIVPICYYDAENDWWISKTKHKQKHKSTVLDVAWHPNSQLIATAACDFKCRIFSAYLAGQEEAKDTDFCKMADFEFGDLIAEFVSSNGWVLGVCWSPSGSHLAFCGQDSSINFVSFPNGQPFCQTLRTNSLPYTALLFLNDKVVVAGGYDFKPDVYQKEDSSWQLLGSADKAQKTKVVVEDEPRRSSQFAGSLLLFSQKESKGTTEADGSADILTKHHNVISDLCLCTPSGNRDQPEGFSSAAHDGRIIIWDNDSLKSVLPGIHV